LLVVVAVIIVAEVKEELFNFSQNFGNDEFIILAKFLIIAGIILPLLSHKPFSEVINISPYQIWFSVVAVSGISYFSYLLKKFVFPKSGIIITALLGGLYSSTATTIILAKKSKTAGPVSGNIAAGIIAATGMMYLRILLLAWIFNEDVAVKLLGPFLILIVVDILMAFLQIRKTGVLSNHLEVESDKNPLEFKTAFIFGALFSFFAILTNIIVANFGDAGVNILSFVVGITDIDPYILNLFQTESLKISVETIAIATIFATTSNNFIKMIYAVILGNKEIKKMMITGFSVIIITSVLIAVFI